MAELLVTLVGINALLMLGLLVFYRVVDWIDHRQWQRTQQVIQTYGPMRLETFTAFTKDRYAVSEEPTPPTRSRGELLHEDPLA